MNPARSGSLFYRTYQNWLDYKAIGDDRDGDPVEIVHLNVVMSDPRATARYNVELNQGKDLWSAVADLGTATSAFVVNGGYFAVPDNLNGLTAHILTAADIAARRPIGFTYNHNVTDGTNGTYLPIPKPYRPYFGAIWCEKNNAIHIDMYDDFIGRHSTVNQVIGYKLDDGTMYATEQPVIEMGPPSPTGDGLTRGQYPLAADGQRMDLYKWAFCCGPVLVYGGKIVFDLDIMLSSQFHVIDTDVQAGPAAKPPNFTRYKLLPRAPNDYMFKSANEGDSAAAYGSRHSNRYMIHNVMAITNTGELVFFFVQGRGYNAPGLDRVQVAHLVQKFNIDRAISLDGGFSANAVLKLDRAPRQFLQDDPEKRLLGTSISFAFGQPEANMAPPHAGFTDRHSEVD
jgi:hypothetical protein